jgi:hypothetical protein
MERSALSTSAVEQATWPAPMFWVVLEHMCGGNRFKHFAQGDVFVPHLLVSVHGESVFARLCLRPDALQHAADSAGIHLSHSGHSVSASLVAVKRVASSRSDPRNGSRRLDKMQLTTRPEI